MTPSSSIHHLARDTRFDNTSLAIDSCNSHATSSIRIRSYTNYDILVDKRIAQTHSGSSEEILLPICSSTACHGEGPT